MTPRKHPSATAADPGHADQSQAEREHAARAHLQAVPPAPRPKRLPPSAVDLLQSALRRSTELDAPDIAHALALLPAARAEVEGLEAGLLFTARSAGLTWAQIAEAMGFNSPQACQQHFTRLTARHGDSADATDTDGAAR